MPKKHLGQHFLIDPAVVYRIAASLNLNPTDHLVEIGPGKGALTQALVGRSKRLDLIEIDPNLIPALQQQFVEKYHAIYLHQADILTFDFQKIAHAPNALRLVGNLPYNISTPLLFRLLAFKPLLQDCLFMLQKEIVQRITASSNTKSYGRLSVMIQYHFKATQLVTVPPEAFHPIPKVDSAMVRLVPFQTLPHTANNATVFAKLVAQAFAHKRKTLKNNLSGIVHPDDWKTIEIDPTLRAEALSIADFVRLSNLIYNRTQEP